MQPTMAKKKSEEATVAARVEEVLRIRLDGAQFHDVVQYSAEKGWGLHDRQLRNYIRRSDELIAERRDKSRRRLIALHLARRESLYARAVNTADYRTGLAILADMAKLQTLYITPHELAQLKELKAEVTKTLDDVERILAENKRNLKAMGIELPDEDATQANP